MEQTLYAPDKYLFSEHNATYIVVIMIMMNNLYR